MASASSSAVGSSSSHRDAPAASASSNADENIQDTLFTHAKAGMDGVDREKIKRLVFEYSKGSAFLAEQERRDEAVASRVAEQKKRRERLGAGEIAAACKRADGLIANLDSTRNLSHIWACVDMDAFYASCEELDDPTLVGVPFAVGGVGMISTASYAARKYGVRSAMPGFIALKLCRELGVSLKLVRGDYAKYERYAAKARIAFACFDPGFIPTSCDEAFIDFTDYCARNGVTADEAARRLRAAVREETGGLTCSVGVAPSRMLAKIASDVNKPNGQHVLPGERDAIAAFLAPLPLRKLPGVGRVAERVLREGLGASTCGELLERRGELMLLFSTREAKAHLTACLGIGGEEPPPPRPDGLPHQKGVSQERTFEATGSEAELRRKMSDIAQMLEGQLEAKGLQARTLTLKLKQDNFRKHERTWTLPQHFGHRSSLSLEPIVTQRFEEQLRANRAGGAPGSVRYRLMGLRATNLRLAPGTEPGGSAGTLASFLQRGGPRTAGCVHDAETAPSASAVPPPTDEEDVAVPAAAGRTAPPAASSKSAPASPLAAYDDDAAWDEPFDRSTFEVADEWEEYDETLWEGADAAGRASGESSLATSPLRGLKRSMSSRGGDSNRYDDEEEGDGGEEAQLQRALALSRREAAEMEAAALVPERAALCEAVVTTGASTTTSVPSEPHPSTDPSWTCGVCTLLNPSTARRCCVCDAMRGGSVAAATTLAEQQAAIGGSRISGAQHAQHREQQRQQPAIPGPMARFVTRSPLR